MGYKKILVTLDGSKLSEQALRHVVTIADPNAYIHVLSVMAEDRVSEIASLVGTTANISVSSPEEQWPRITPIPDPRAIHAREDYLNEVTEWLEPIGFNVTVDARPGEIIQTIVETARDGFDVIVMATHGRSGLAKVIMGSVAEGVLHKAPCPVLIIPVRPTEPTA